MDLGPVWSCSSADPRGKAVSRKRVEGEQGWVSARSLEMARGTQELLDESLRSQQVPNCPKSHVSSGECTEGPVLSCPDLRNAGNELSGAWSLRAITCPQDPCPLFAKSSHTQSYPLSSHEDNLETSVRHPPQCERQQLPPTCSLWCRACPTHYLRSQPGEQPTEMAALASVTHLRS